MLKQNITIKSNSKVLHASANRIILTQNNLAKTP